MTVLIAGHVDHGKSTITGHLLVECNVVSEREMRKWVELEDGEAQSDEGSERTGETVVQLRVFDGPEPRGGGIPCF